MTPLRFCARHATTLPCEGCAAVKWWGRPVYRGVYERVERGRTFRAELEVKKGRYGYRRWNITELRDGAWKPAGRRGQVDALTLAWAMRNVLGVFKEEEERERAAKERAERDAKHEKTLAKFGSREKLAEAYRKTNAKSGEVYARAVKLRAKAQYLFDVMRYEQEKRERAALDQQQGGKR